MNTEKRTPSNGIYSGFPERIESLSKFLVEKAGSLRERLNSLRGKMIIAIATRMQPIYEDEDNEVRQALEAGAEDLKGVTVIPGERPNEIILEFSEEE